jgi:hypothetical protein
MELLYMEMEKNVSGEGFREKIDLVVYMFF